MNWRFTMWTHLKTQLCWLLGQPFRWHRMRHHRLGSAPFRNAGFMAATPMQTVNRLSFVNGAIIVMGVSALLLTWSLSDDGTKSGRVITNNIIISTTTGKDRDLHKWMENNAHEIKKFLAPVTNKLIYPNVSRANYVVVPKNEVTSKNGDAKRYKLNNNTINRAHFHDKRHKLILFWTTVYNQPSFMTGIQRFLNCKYSDCEFIIDRKKIKDAAAVMFHMWDMKKSADLPNYRSPDQYWVLFGRESPVNTEVTSQYKSVFNLTQTYRSDADIHLSYGLYRPKQGRQVGLKDYSKGKSKLVSWTVSHCESDSKREDYADELKKYIQVDIYGKCGFLTCEKWGPNSCFGMLKNDYKFYLAFENSLCWEYITEKVWNALYYDTVPIVLGYANYTRLLPPNSFIDIRDFKSPKALAQYLLLLDGNASLYNKYFEWKTKYEISLSSTHICDICELLHTKENFKQTYTNIDKWWNQCTQPGLYFSGVYDALT